MDLNNIENFSNWEKWKHNIAIAVNAGESVGLSQESIQKIGYKIGNFLSARIDPENREHRLLQELWRVGDDSDRMVLSKLIVKMVQTDKH